MTSEGDSYTDAAKSAICAAVDGEPDFAGWLAGLLEAVARERGGSRALVARQPSSWNAEHVRRLAAGADIELSPDVHRDRAYTAHGRRPCLACGRPIWFSRVWNGLVHYAQPLGDGEAWGWLPIKHCPHCGESLAEFALLSHGFPESV